MGGNYFNVPYSVALQGISIFSFYVSENVFFIQRVYVDIICPSALYRCYSTLFFLVIISSCFLNFYCYSVTVVCLFSPSLHPTPAEPTSLPHLHHPPWFCLCISCSSSCNPLSSLSPPHSPLAIVRLFSLQCLWLYFVCFFLLLIMFQLKVRSYGICPSPPGLFHLA